jgi:ApbE superfamily uncharacterized protein (UPF0280 family)
VTQDLRSRETYRRRVTTGGRASFSVRIEQTDLFILAEKDLSAAAYDLTAEARGVITAWGEGRPEFFRGLEPIPMPADAPPIVREMIRAGRAAGVGPMAAVAGAVAEFVGRGLMPLSPSGVIVENGGDVFLFSTADLTVGLFAGQAALSMKLGLRLPAERTPAGVCTSTGSFGHSLSYGKAEAATVVADTAALADAAATALGNRLNTPQNLTPALEWVLTVPGVRGAAAAIEGRAGFLGELEIVPV